MAPCFEHAGQVHPVALAAREHAHLFLLIRARKVEPRHIRPRIDLHVSQLDGVLAVGDHLPDGFFRIQTVPALIHVGQVDGFTDRMVPVSGFSWPVIIRNSVVLPAPFGPMTPTMPPGGREKAMFSNSSRFP